MGSSIVIVSSLSLMFSIEGRDLRIFFSLFEDAAIVKIILIIINNVAVIEVALVKKLAVPLAVIKPPKPLPPPSPKPSLSLVCNKTSTTKRIARITYIIIKIVIYVSLYIHVIN